MASQTIVLKNEMYVMSTSFHFPSVKLNINYFDPLRNLPCMLSTIRTIFIVLLLTQILER